MPWRWPVTHGVGTLERYGDGPSHPIRWNRQAECCQSCGCGVHGGHGVAERTLSDATSPGDPRDPPVFVPLAAVCTPVAAVIGADQ